MAQRPGVPRFGCWEGEGEILYSVKARKAGLRERQSQTKGPRVNLWKDASKPEPDPSRQKEKLTEKLRPSDVPKFGDWEGQVDVPYTLYFDEVHKGNGSGKSKRPNDRGDAVDNPSSKVASPAQARSPASYKPVEEKSHEDQERRKNGVQNVHKVVTDKSANQPQVGPAAAKRSPVRQSPDSEHSTGRSARATGRVNGRPSPKQRSPAETRYATPGRLRMKVNKGADDVDLGATIPVFGVWDDAKPSSSEGYNDIFNKGLEKRQTAKEPSTDGDLYHQKSQTGSNKPKAKAQRGCCILWGRK